MRAKSFLALMFGLFPVACFPTQNTDQVIDQEPAEDALVWAAGPAMTTSLRVDDADVWVVPQLPAYDSVPMGSVTWVLQKPTKRFVATIVRTCKTDDEARLALSNSADAVYPELGTIDACSTLNIEYSGSIDIMFDGERWVGISAYGIGRTFSQFEVP